MFVPVLRLPHLAFENVYKHLEIPDIIMLSQCSKRMKTIRIAQKIHYPTPTWINAPQAGAIEEDLLKIVQICQDLFRCSIDKIRIRFFEEVSFEKLLRCSSTLHTAHEIVIQWVKFSPSEMNFIFDNFNAEKLYFSGDSEESYSYQKPVLQFPNIQFNFAQWITPAHFMEMAETCKKIKFFIASLITDQDLNMFIKTWLAGTNDILEYVEISRDSDYATHTPVAEPFERDVILDGLEYIVLENENDPELDEEDQDPDARMEVKIERDDGKLARVIVHQETSYDYGRFQFIVVKESC